MMLRSAAFAAPGYSFSREPMKRTFAHSLAFVITLSIVAVAQQSAPAIPYDRICWAGSVPGIAHCCVHR